MKIFKEIKQRSKKALRYLLRGPNDFRQKSINRKAMTVVASKIKTSQNFKLGKMSNFKKILALGAVASVFLTFLFRSLDINIFPNEKATKAVWSSQRQLCELDQFCVYIYDFSIQGAYRSYGGIKYLSPGTTTYGQASEYQFNYNEAIFRLGPPAVDGRYKAWVHGLNSNYYVVTDIRNRIIPQWILDTGAIVKDTYQNTWDQAVIWPSIPAVSHVVNPGPITAGDVSTTAGQWVFLFVDQYATATSTPMGATSTPSNTSITRTFTATNTPFGPTFTPTNTVPTSTVTNTVLSSTPVSTNTPTNTVPTNTATNTPSFTRTFTATSTPTNTCIVPDDVYETDNIAGAPDTVPVGSEVGVSVAAIAVDGAPQMRNFSCKDQDLSSLGVWYGADHVHFSGDVNNWYRVTTYDLGSNADTYIKLYYLDKVSGLIVALPVGEDDDSGPGLGSQIVFQASQSTRYYVKIYNWYLLNANIHTNYKIEVKSGGGPTATSTLTATITPTFPTSTSTSTLTLTNTFTNTSTNTATVTATWGIGDWSDDYYLGMGANKIPAAMHRQGSIGGQWLGYTSTYLESAVNNPPELKDSGDDGLLINEKWPSNDTFTVYYDQILQLSTCYRFVGSGVRNYTLGIWIDWNGDGDYSDTYEEFITVVNDTNRLCQEKDDFKPIVGASFNVYPSLVGASGNRSLRIRAYPQGTSITQVSATGPFENGEVEDYLLYIDLQPTVTVTTTSTNTATATATATPTSTLQNPLLFQIEKTPGKTVTCGNPSDIVRLVGNYLVNWSDVKNGMVYFQYNGITTNLSYGAWYNNEIANVLLPAVPANQITPDVQAVIWAQRLPDYALSNNLYYCFYTPTPLPTNTFTVTRTPSFTSTFTNTNTFTFTPSYTLTQTPTFTNTFSPTITDTATITNTATETPTGTWFSPTNTFTPSRTSTFTFTPTAFNRRHEVLIKVLDDNTRKQVKDSLVKLISDNGSYTEQDYTDSDGEVLFTGVINDYYSVKIDYCGKTTTNRLLVRSSDDFRITKTYYVSCLNYTVTVRVQNSSGTPIANATVTLDNGKLYTNTKGEAKFTGIAKGSYTAVAKKDNLEGSKTFTVPDELNPLIILGASGSHRLVIHTIDADTRADLANVKVEVGGVIKNTNTVGRVYYDDIKKGNHWAYITYCSYNETPFAFSIDADDPQEVEVTFELFCNRYNVTVHVRDSKGSVIPNASVVLNNNQRGTTDKNGLITFVNVTAGNHEAKASKDGKTGSEKFKVPEELEPVVIIDITGLPVTGVPLMIILPFAILFLEAMGLYFLLKKPLKKKARK